MIKPIPFIRENFIEEMENLSDFRNEHYEEGEFPGCDFRTIHFYQVKHPKEKAAIVISHGFCEFVHKFDELIYYFYQQEFSVYFIDHRGHGKSHRTVKDMDKVDVYRFYDYVDDLNCFMDMVVKPTSPDLPIFIYSHSMGGAIAAAYLEEYPGTVKAAVLSSPMMEMNLGKFHRGFVLALVNIKRFFKKGQKYAPANHGFDEKYNFENSGALSKERYEYFFNYRLKDECFRTYGGSNNWLATALHAQKKIVKNASKISVPVILFQAGKDRVVNPGGQNEFAKGSDFVELVVYPNSKHEIYNALDEDREQYISQVMEFFWKNI